jgi:repressor LexA
MTLSEKQSKVLAYIEQELARTGRPPTFRDIASHCGPKGEVAVGTIQDHVRALIKKGYLVKEPGVARGLRLAHHAGSIDIPILGTVPAGRPIEAIEDARGALSIPPRWRGELYALQVTGDSMIDAGIFEGDLVVVRKQDHADDGDIVVALLEGEATVKYLDKKHARLLPANERYSPIPLSEGATIQGKVVSLQRFY